MNKKINEGAYMDYQLCDLTCPFNVNNQNTFTNSRPKDANFPVMLEDNNSRILLVFEAPGFYEWKNKCPIYDSRYLEKRDSAGSRMAQAFEDCEINRKDYDIAEVVSCFPGPQGGIKQYEVAMASICCRKYLFDYIYNKRYDKIVCWGYIAHNSVIDIVREIQGTDVFYCPSIMSAKHPTAPGNTQSAVNKDIIRCL